MNLKKFVAIILGAFVMSLPILDDCSVAGATAYNFGSKIKWKKDKIDNDTVSSNIRLEDNDQVLENSKQVLKNNYTNNIEYSNDIYAVDSVNDKDYRLNVSLSNGVAQASVCMNSEYNIIDMYTGKVLGRFHGNVVTAIKAAGSKLSINGKTVNSQSIALQPVTKLENNFVKYNGTSYRGTLNVKLDKNGSLVVVNNIDIDEYLLSTVPSEMEPSYPKAALEAQAVAARTYAIYTLNKHSSEGADLCDNTHCQVYGGIAKENSSSTAAVNATKGYVMTYGGKPICAVFHSSSGGRTDNAENVWGSYVPYLRSVADDDSQSPYHNWKVSFSNAEMQKFLIKAGKNIGTVKQAQLLSKASDRSIVIRFKGSNGIADLTGANLRSLLGLKSSMFTVKMVGNQVVFEGHGYGHGLGMSQYGAKAMASKGKDWKAILNHYYTNININKMY